MQGTRFAAALVCLCSAMLAYGGDALRLHLSGPANDAMHDFRAALQGHSSLHVTFTDAPDDAAVLLPVGDAAFDAAPQTKPVFAVKVSPDLLDARRRQGCQCSGIYRGAAAADQLALLRTVLPSARRVGVVLPEDAAERRQALEQAADGLQLHFETVDSADGLSVALAALLPRVDALLLLPEPALFNAETARLLLLTSYRQGRPVIGPDEAFVRAGSLASVYASEADLVSATLSALARVSAGAPLPPPASAARSVAINPHVARAYGVTHTDTGELQQSLWGQP